VKKPLTRALLKIMATGFYRQHTGFLLALLVLVFSSFFYTNVLNQTHLTPAQQRQTALKLVLSSVSEPLGVLILFGLFLLYTVKSRHYLAARLQEADVQFLRYSSNALRWSRQVQSWALVQLIISLPLVIVGLYAMLIGVVYGYWLIPLLIPVYLLALTVWSAAYYTRLLNEHLLVPPALTDRLTGLRGWPKPLFSLFLYELLVHQRVPFALTKVVSLTSMGLLFYVFPDAHTDQRLLGLTSLTGALAQVVLLYQAHMFERSYLRFARNFPYPTWQQYGQQIALYSVLLLPEIGWLLVVGPFRQGLLAAGLLLNVTLFFRNLLYPLGSRMTPYLRRVFGLFMGFLLLNLFGLTGLLFGGSTVLAGVLFSRYREQE